MGDIETDECDTPRKSKNYFHIAKAAVLKQRKQLTSYNKKVNRLRRKVNSLQELLKVMREKYNISETAEQSLEVRHNLNIY